MYEKFFPTLLVFLSIASPGQADFLDTTWYVEKFTGEAWALDPATIMGAGQNFYRGYSEGIFYSCDYNHQSKTYTTYDIESFFLNPEFRLFEPLRSEISSSAQTIFVHRITCSSPDDVGNRRVLYPFVTNDVRQQAWYLFEGGVYSMRSHNSR